MVEAARTSDRVDVARYRRSTTPDDSGGGAADGPRTEVRGPSVAPGGGLPEDGGVLDQLGRGPGLAEAPGVAGVEGGEDDHRDGAEDVVVDHRVVLGGQGDGPHHQVEDCSGGRGDPHADAQGEGEADAEQGQHEQRVGPDGAADAVVEALERAVGAELEEALGGAAAVDPGGVAEAVEVAVLVVAGVEAQGQQLVEERPQEGQPEADPEQGQRTASQGRGGLRVLGGGRAAVSACRWMTVILRTSFGRSLGGAFSLVEARRARSEERVTRWSGPWSRASRAVRQAGAPRRADVAGSARAGCGRSPASPRGPAAGVRPARRRPRGAGRRASRLPRAPG